MVTGCSSGPSAESIGETTADAIRDAGTVQFTMTSGEETFEGAAVYEEGDLSELRVETTTLGEERSEWVVDGEYWRAPGTARPERSGSVDPEEFVAAWDWAQVQEDMAAAATSIEAVEAREIDGLETHGFELVSEERTETWWVDDDGRLREYEFEFADGQSGGGTLFGYGDDVRIFEP